MSMQRRRVFFFLEKRVTVLWQRTKENLSKEVDCPLLLKGVKPKHAEGTIHVNGRLLAFPSRYENKGG